MSLAILPTREREQHAPGRVTHPEISQRRHQRASEVASYVKTLYKLGKLSDREYHAGQKFERHWLGAQGLDVRWDIGGHTDLVGEEGVVYHGQRVEEARRLWLPHQYRAVVDTIEERKQLHEIGSAWMETNNRPQSYAAGLALVKLSLAQLSVYWGFG